MVFLSSLIHAGWKFWIMVLYFHTKIKNVRPACIKEEKKNICLSNFWKTLPKKMPMNYKTVKKKENNFYWRILIETNIYNDSWVVYISKENVCLKKKPSITELIQNVWYWQYRNKICWKSVWINIIFLNNSLAWPYVLV